MKTFELIIELIFMISVVITMLYLLAQNSKLKAEIQKEKTNLRILTNYVDRHAKSFERFLDIFGNT